MATLVEQLAEHVEHFNCSVYDDGRLKLFPDPPVKNNQHKGILVGQVSKISKHDWQIVSLEYNAPAYLKPLVGKSYPGQNLLKAAVRKAAFIALFEAVNK